MLIATGLYAPDIGGPATYTKFLEEELPSKGFIVEVVSFGTVRRFPKIFRHGLYFLYVLIQSADVKSIYALDPVSVGLPAFIASKLLRKKFILRVAGDYAWEQYSQRSKVKGQKFLALEEFQKQKFDFITELRRKVERYVARKADIIVVPSEYLKKVMLMWGVSEENIHVIYNTFDAVSVSLKKEDARGMFGLTGTILLSAGRLVPWKGFEMLIEVVVELKEKFHDIHLYIAGDGPENKKLQAVSSKIQAPVIFLGLLSHEVLSNYIRASDIFVLNTGYEGLSHQLLDVMALRTPIITTNIGGNPEVVENLKNGLLVPYNDKEATKNAIELLLRDRGLRERLMHGGVERVLFFSKEKAVGAIARLLSK